MKKIRNHIVSAKVYLFNPLGHPWENKSLPEVAFSKETWSLNSHQIDLALKTVTQKLPGYGQQMTWCYQPRHLIMFYGKDKRKLGHIKICFYCLNYRAYPVTRVAYNEVTYFRKIMEELNVPIFAEQEAYIDFFREKDIIELMSTLDRGILM